MTPRTYRFGPCKRNLAYRIGTLIFSIAGSSVSAVEPSNIRAKTFDIEYQVNEGALPLDSVELWYTRDDGASWKLFGTDEDRQSPFSFTAPEEGTYGFFIILKNATGASSPPLKEGTSPQQTVFVDYTPPLVQLHAPKLDVVNGQRMLQIRWSAVDSQFGARPIELAYQHAPQRTWSLLTPDAVANTGRYDWRIPDELKGSVTIRVAASDRGGNRVATECPPVEVTGPESAAPQQDMQIGPTGGQDSTIPGSKRARERVARLFEEAMALRDRGEYSESMARFREVARLDPMKTDAFAEMGALLHRMGDLERAMNAFEIALKQQPNLRSALLGTALIYKQRSDYPTAAERLRAILKYNPNDAEVWLHLGDVAVYQGDEVFARECYTRAAQINPDATPIVSDARKRLALMAETSRSYTVARRSETSKSQDVKMRR